MAAASLKKQGPPAAAKDFYVARSEGFEPPTLGFEVRCSIQLSYERGLVRWMHNSRFVAKVTLPRNPRAANYLSNAGSIGTR